MRNIRFAFISLLCCIISIQYVQSQNAKILDKVKDIEGNTYQTIIIGTQIWMAENLKTTKFSNGDIIETTNPDTLNIRYEKAPKCQWGYLSNDSIIAIYGRLYTWFVVNDSRNVCPLGWHVSTDADWRILTKYLGGDSLAQCKLKEAGLVHWKNPNFGATNESGFTALPGGNRWDYGRFVGLGEFTHWWTSTESKSDTCLAWRRLLKNKETVKNYRGCADKKLGWYVRCVKN